MPTSTQSSVVSTNGQFRDKADQTTLVFLIAHLGLGGSEHQLFLVLSHLDKTRFDCHVVVFNPSDNYVFDDTLEKMGVHIWNIPRNRSNILQRMIHVYSLFRRIKPDIVHSWSFHDNPYAGLIGLFAGVKVRFGSLRNSLLLDNTQRLNPILRWLALYSISKLFVNATSIAQELEKIHYPSHRITVLQNCVDQEVFARAEPADLSDLGIDPEQQVVGLIANLRPVKGHLLFIDSMVEVLRSLDNVVALIVGQPIPSEPEYPDIIQARIEASGMRDRIIMAGFRKDVPALMKRMSVVCLTSDSEGMPNVILEAMAASRPIVATPVGGIMDIIEHEKTGLLAQDHNNSSVANCILQILTNQTFAHQLGANGLEWVQHNHDCLLLVHQLTSLYDRLLLK